MSRLVILCVECNIQSESDYVYISETIKHFYVDDKKVIIRPVYLGSKTKYNSKDVCRKIKGIVAGYKGAVNVVYCIDYDDYNVSYETKVLFDNIKTYCDNNSYEFVFFNKDIEDVYWGAQVTKSEKVKKAAEFRHKHIIGNVDPEKLVRDNANQKGSNILNVLDKFLKRK